MVSSLGMELLPMQAPRPGATPAKHSKSCQRNEGNGKRGSATAGRLLAEPRGGDARRNGAGYGEKMVPQTRYNLAVDGDGV